MAPNKFEEQIKAQLQEREIPPSANAWERISERLEVSERPKSKRYYGYGIAAGFIGILFISILYFTLKEPVDVPKTEITDTPENPARIEKVPETVSEEKIVEESSKESEVNFGETIEITSAQDLNVVPKNTLVSFSKKVIEETKVVIPLNTSEEIINTKIAEIVAQVEVLENENSHVTNAEIDSLLRQAQQEILGEKIFKNDNSVDAMALLADVEEELDQSFRDRIFDALKDGYLKIRTAVADRNK